MMKANKTPISRGGARPGAGRPRSDRQRRNIKITDEWLAYAEKIGEGNISNGIEIALRYHQTTSANSATYASSAPSPAALK